MPLVRGQKAKTKAGVSQNIKAELKAGRPKDQATAIALRLAGRRKPR